MNLHVLEKGAVKRIAFVAVLLAVLAIVLAAAPPEADADTIVTAPGEVTWTLDDTGLPTVEEGAAGPMPAAFFTGEAAGITVNVNAEDGAFDQKVEMVLAPVYDPAVLEQIAEGIGTAARNVTAIDIAFVNSDGEEVEPLAPVKVTLVSDAIGEAARIAHLANSGDVEEMEAEIDGGVAAFESGAFSVYAVVDDLLEVKFIVNESEVASMYVKKGDNMERTVYNPGVGTLEDDVFFRGWTTDENYKPTTAAKTIAEVRTELTDILNAENPFVSPVVQVGDDYVITYHAMLFKSYTITYFDEYGYVSLGQVAVVFRADDTTVTDDNPATYIVNMAYSTGDNQHNFEGWLVQSGGDHIKEYETNKVYQNEDTIGISGDVEFKASVVVGNWLVFNENGKGAKYNAPMFLETDEATSKPCPDSEMTRFGYTFGGLYPELYGSGWYTDEYCTAGNEFTFGSTLTDYTTIYAKWVSNTVADYTVIIWKQNVSGNGYDFYKSVRIEDATVGTTPDAVTFPDDTGNNDYAIVDGTAYTSTSSDATIRADFTGFHFSSTDQSRKTVATEGNTVVNVWYDRNQITYNFYTYEQASYVYTLITGNPSTASGHPTYYALIDGQYRELTHYPYSRWYGPEGWYYGGYSQYDRGTQYTDDDFYTRETAVPAGWNVTITMAGLYGSTLEANRKVWPTDHDWYSNGGNNGSVSGTRTTFLDAFLPTSNDTTINFYGTDASGSNHVYFYKQDADKQGYTLANTVNTDATAFNLSDKYSGFKCVAWNTSNSTSNWNKVGELMNQSGNYYYDANPSQPGYQTASIGNNGLHVYFDRKDFSLTFLNGSYYNTTGSSPMLAETASPTEFKKDDGISYGADLSSYGKGKENYYVPPVKSGYEGYVFDGWYLDDQCTYPCTFTTMPEGGLTVYAKWMKIQYRVFLDPKYPEGATEDIDWGTNQAMSFRVDHGGKISAPYGRLDGYEFVGWYLDEACTSRPFNDDAYVLNETTVTDPYNKDTDYTDTYDQNGNLTNPSNSDKTGYGGEERFWITKKIVIYAKWRSVLDDASGIHVIYDLNGGSVPDFDDNLFVDRAQVLAVFDDIEAPRGYEFAYWVVQTWENNEYADTEIKVFPGETFEVKEAFAKVEDETNPETTDTKKYTVQLRAEYVAIEEPTPAQIIYWFNNDGTGDYSKNDGLDINEGVGFPDEPTREGYTFLGWARIDINGDGTDDSAAEDWVNDSDNRTQPLTADDLYIYYGSGYYVNKITEDGAIQVPVTQVAADANDPYRAMFAVWNVTVTVVAGTGGTYAEETEPFLVDVGTAISADNDTLTVGEREFTASAGAGYRFDAWTFSDGVVDGKVAGNVTATANFVKQYTVTVVAGAGGSYAAVTDPYPVDVGTAISASGATLTVGEATYKATADSGYRFDSWTFSDGGVADGKVAGDVTATANFVKQYTVTVVQGEHTTISGVQSGHTITAPSWSSRSPPKATTRS